MVQHTGEMEELLTDGKRTQDVGGNETPPDRVWVNITYKTQM